MEDNKIYLKVVDNGFTVLVEGTVKAMVENLFVLRFKNVSNFLKDFNASPKTSEDLLVSLERCNKFEGKAGKYSLISEEEFNTLKEKDDNLVVIPMKMFK